MPSFTVVHAAGMTNDNESREYDRLLNHNLLKQNVNLAEVPRVREPGGENGWLYAWPKEEEARDFAERLNKKTKTSGWIVKPLQEGTIPSIGPLRPIEIRVGHQRNGYVFALAPWAFMAIRAAFPGSCQTERVFIGMDVKGDPQAIRADIERLAGMVLPMLTNLEVEQLATFEKYVVKDPVTYEVMVPSRPIGT